MDVATDWSGHPPEVYNNNLLNALSAADFRALAPNLSGWSASRGDRIFEPGDRISHAYFPCGPALVSYLVILEDGKAIETALIGREGAIGGIASQGSLPAYARAEVQSPGPFLRIEIAKLEELKSQSLSLRNLFARYADCLVAEIYQATACNAVHSIEQRTAKWLLAAMERTGTPEIDLTQGQLSAMIGVGRSYLSRVLQRLKLGSLLDTRRGGLVVTNRRGLESLACGCDKTLQLHRSKVLGEIYPSGKTSLRAL